MQKLLTIAVVGDGHRFRMTFTCQDGGEGSIGFPTECLQELIMTLPRIMKEALRARYHDDSLRLVYPAAAIRLEHSSDPKTFILTLVTPDGFEVSFGLTQQHMAVFAADALRRNDTDGETPILN